MANLEQSSSLEYSDLIQHDVELLDENTTFPSTLQAFESEESTEWGDVPELFKKFLDTLKQNFYNDGDKPMVDIASETAEETLRGTLKEEFPYLPPYVIDYFIDGLKWVSKKASKPLWEVLSKVLDKDTKEAAREIASSTPKENINRLKKYIQDNKDDFIDATIDIGEKVVDAANRTKNKVKNKVKNFLWI